MHVSDAEVERRNQQRLKPCNRCTPLIGNGVLLTLFHSTESDIGGYYPASVMCNQCRRQIWGGKTDESAIKAWNKTQGRAKIRDGIVCGLCHRYVYLGGTVTKDCTSCVKLYRQLEKEREKEKHERSI